MKLFTSCHVRKENVIPVTNWKMINWQKGKDMQDIRKHITRAILWAATLALMMVIFGFSAQSGEESGSVSAIITEPLTELVADRMDEELSEAEEQMLYSQIDHYVRKTAHFCEYALLGLLLHLLCRSYGLLQRWIPWLIGTVYAATDELHQIYQPNRSGQISDVVLDSAGVFAGILFIWLMIQYRRKKHVHHP